MRVSMFQQPFIAVLMCTTAMGLLFDGAVLQVDAAGRKESWPELVGVMLPVAKDQIQKDCPRCAIVVLRPNQPVPPYGMPNPYRVTVYVDDSDRVISPPVIG